jgi:hypothetical protein
VLDIVRVYIFIDDSVPIGIRRGLVLGVFGRKLVFHAFPGLSFDLMVNTSVGFGA